jgi:hypothetical protein
MSFDGFGDELFWDEHQWEAHLDELEKRSEQLRRFITSDPKGNLPRWITLLQENLDENQAVDAFIEEELLLDETYFPEDEDDWEDDEDEFEDDDFFFLNDEEIPFYDEEDDDDFDAGEEWKFLSEEYADSDYGSLENLHIYTTSKILAVDVLKWAESVHEQYHNNTYHDFVGEILKISAKLAGGFSFGFEQDFLGGNIAYNKKGLYCANNALHMLQKQRKAPYMTSPVYHKLHSRLFELRNDIGIYIQELRDRFNFGVE